jgi:hypothetical protein
MVNQDVYLLLIVSYLFIYHFIVGLFNNYLISLLSIYISLTKSCMLILSYTTFYQTSLCTLGPSYFYSPLILLSTNNYLTQYLLPYLRTLITPHTKSYPYLNRKILISIYFSSP